MIALGSVVSGKYQLSRLLGDGGMGSVYEARHTVLGTRVAIKVLHPELGRRTGLVERFLQEARVAAQIRSPHVVQVTDVDRTPEGHAYIVMELLEGEALSSVLDRQRRLPVAIACEHTLQILQALEAAHALGVIHRDLKPENVFVTFPGGKPVLKLIDFGIAKARRSDPQQRNLTVAGVVMGTAEYMAPEQARSAGEVDARADLYAVGVMLYEMIAGMRPVNGEDARIIALRVERGEVVPLVQAAPDVPREIAGFVHRAMASRPALRFASATEMRLALENVSAARRSLVGPSAPPSTASEPPMGHGTLKNIPARQSLDGASVPPTALVPPISRPTTDVEAPVHTERAPPLGTAMTPPAAGYAGVAIPPPNAGSHHRGGPMGAGRLAAMIALPLMLAAVAVMILMATGTWSPGAEPARPAPSLSVDLADAGAMVAPPPSVATAAPTSTVPSIPTLVPTARPPAAPVTPRPAPSGRPQPPHVADAGEAPGPAPMPPPPFGLPTTLPPFPALPSGFPTLFPPWPPAPAPAPANSGSAGSI